MANYAMYTEDGNRAVQHMFDTLKLRLQADVKLLGELNDDLKQHRPGYTDTAVREAVAYGLSELLYEALEYFGEGLLIEGEAFRLFFLKYMLEKEDAACFSRKRQEWLV